MCFQQNKQSQLFQSSTLHHPQSTMGNEAITCDQNNILHLYLFAPLLLIVIFWVRHTRILPWSFKQARAAAPSGQPSIASLAPYLPNFRKSLSSIKKLLPSTRLIWRRTRPKSQLNTRFIRISKPSFNKRPSARPSSNLYLF